MRDIERNITSKNW